MNRVLVTGGAGFIGSHIVEELLQHDFEVIVIDNFSTGNRINIEKLPIKLFYQDITKQSIVDFIVSLQPDYIIHQAAQVSVSESVQNPLFDENVNIKGSLHIIDAAIKCGVKKIVFASSAAVYGNPVTLPVRINHPINPESPYGISKLTVERYLQFSNKLYKLPYSILRYSNVYGPRQDATGEGGVVSIFSDRLTKHISPVIYGDGEQTRDFINVKDVAKANVKALFVEENICVNVSSCQSVSINELFQMLKDAANSDVIAVHQQDRPGDIRHSILSNKETKEILNWEPVINLSDGLNETIQYYRKRRKVPLLHN